MLQALMKSNPGSDYIYVVDTRPKVTLSALVWTVNGEVMRAHCVLVHS